VIDQSNRIVAGLSTTVAGSATTAKLTVVFLHGYAMDTHDLVPFAHSMRAPAIFMFPQGPHQAESAGRAWWNIDLDKRRAALQLGPRDLFDEYPTGREVTRSRLREFVEAIKRDYPEHSVVLAGFSQGGMAICDLLLHEPVTVQGLALLSTSRLAFDEWRPNANRMEGLPILISHGETDDDLSFEAGEKLRDWLVESGADVTWVPFQGGHQIPLGVWRRLRQFLARMALPSSSG